MGVSGERINDSVKLALSEKQAVGTPNDVPDADDALTVSQVTKSVVANLAHESQDEECIKDRVSDLLNSYALKQRNGSSAGAVKRIDGRKRYWLDLQNMNGGPEHSMDLFACLDSSHAAATDGSAPQMLVSTPILGSNGPANEIREFKKLLDEGIITQEEFTKAKTNLIARMSIT